MFLPPLLAQPHAQPTQAELNTLPLCLFPPCAEVQRAAELAKELVALRPLLAKPHVQTTNLT